MTLHHVFKETPKNTERRDGCSALNSRTISGELHARSSGAVARRKSHPNKTHRFLRRAAARPRDAGRADSDVRAQPRAYALRHLDRHLFAYGANALERFRQNAERIYFNRVVVRDDAAL